MAFGNQNLYVSFPAANPDRRLTLPCPEPTVAKIGSGRSPGTLENEKLPFAMRLRYSWLNGSYAALADGGQILVAGR